MNEENIKTSELDSLKQQLSDLTNLVTQLIKQPVKKPRKKTVTKKSKTIKSQITPKQAKIIKIEQPTQTIPTNPQIMVVRTGQLVSQKTGGNRSCRQEPINTKAITNKFLNSPLCNSHKNDIEIDKKLSGNLTPSPRRDAVIMVDINCSICGKSNIVNPDIIPRDFDTGEFKYTCDSCIRSR